MKHVVASILSMSDIENILPPKASLVVEDEAVSRARLAKTHLMSSQDI